MAALPLSKVTIGSAFCDSRSSFLQANPAANISSSRSGITAGGSSRICVAPASKRSGRTLVGPRASIQTLEPTALAQTWTQFSQGISGEWAGYSSDFDAVGRPIRLPKDAIPEPFSQWGLDLFAWQTDCITKAAKDNGSVQYSCTRLLPALAMASKGPYLEDIRKAGIGEESAGVLAYRNDGCYAVAWPGESELAGPIPHTLTRKDTGANGEASSRFFELEHCMVARDPTCEEKQARARVRLLQRFEKPEAGMSGGKLPRLVGMTLYRERWVGDGEGGYTSGGVEFAEGPQVLVTAIEGRWVATNTRADLKLVSIQCGHEHSDSQRLP